MPCRYRPVIMRLMEHPMNAGVFNEPVDPVALEIPDYFDIVRTQRGRGGVGVRVSPVCHFPITSGSRSPELFFKHISVTAPCAPAPAPAPFPLAHLCLR